MSSTQYMQTECSDYYSRSNNNTTAKCKVTEYVESYFQHGQYNKYMKKQVFNVWAQVSVELLHLAGGCRLETIVVQSWLTKTEPWEHSWNNFDRTADRLLQKHSCTQEHTCNNKHKCACGHIRQNKNTHCIHTHAQETLSLLRQNHVTILL